MNKQPAFWTVKVVTNGGYYADTDTAPCKATTFSEGKLHFDGMVSAFAIAGYELHDMVVFDGAGAYAVLSKDADRQEDKNSPNHTLYIVTLQEYKDTLDSEAA